MAMSEALKIARLQARMQREHDLMELVKIFAPAISWVGGVAIINGLANKTAGRPFDAWSQDTAQITAVGLGAIVTAQVLAPVLPTVASETGSIVSGIVKALPVAVAAAAAL